MSCVVIISASKSDMEHTKRIKDMVEKFGVECVVKIASAHKTPLKVLEIIKNYEDKNVVFITVAGRSNALSGFVDANTHCPVIACPPYSDKFGGMDIISNLRMPSGVSPMVVLEPEEAGLAAVKILAIADRTLKEKIKKLQEYKKEEIERADRELTQ